MGNRLRTACILLGLLLLNPEVFTQDEESAWGGQNRTIPETLRRPERGEAPRYPTDVVIGELGQGESPDRAYGFAKNLLSILISGNKEEEIIRGSGSVLTESLLEEINSLKPRSYRLGGGRIEADGSVSFMVRFLGAEESITGELYVRRAEGPVTLNEGVSDETDTSGKEDWLLDDLILEEKRELTEIRDSYRYDFSPYERFY